MIKMPIIDHAKCSRCGLCVSICKCGILMMEGDSIKVVAEENCGQCITWCNTCELVCPEGAITCPFEIVLDDSK